MVDITSVDALERDLVPRPKMVAVAGNEHRSVVTIGDEHTLVIDEPEQRGGTDTGPTPLQTLVAALCACEVTTFHKTADRHGLAYEALEVKATYLTGLADVDGAEATRIQTIRLQLTVTTDADEDDFRVVVDETERRCPVLAILTQTDVRLEILWVRDPR
jgi:uncharacterized OsmC-like protein